MSLDLHQTNQMLERIRSGDPDAAGELLSRMYQELKAVAVSCMAHQPADHTLQPTALVHEAYVRVFGREQPAEANNREHFVRIAAQAMRQVLVDHARAKRTLKRGQGDRPVPLDRVLAHFEEQSLDVVEFDDVVTALGELDPELARIVELRFFAGLTVRETAQTLSVSPTTVERQWRVARMWLRSRLQYDPGPATAEDDS